MVVEIWLGQISGKSGWKRVRIYIDIWPSVTEKIQAVEYKHLREEYILRKSLIPCLLPDVR